MSDKKKLPIVIYDDVLSLIYNFYLEKRIKNTAVAIAFYLFLYKTVRIQENIRVYATDSFIKKGLGIGTNKLKEVKRDLKEMGLIETIRPRNKQGMFEDKTYTEVKFIWKPETLDKLFYSESSDETEIKIAKELLLNNFGANESIKSNINDFYTFIIFKDGQEVELSADSFYFDDGLLKCEAEFGLSGNTITYTIPSDRVAEIVLDLANSYTFNFKTIQKTLNTKQESNYFL